MSNKVKNQHYVPRTHLKYFSSAYTIFDNKGNHFYVYDKDKKESRKGNIENYSSERYFYDVDFDKIHENIKMQEYNNIIPDELIKITKTLDPQHIENHFADFVEGNLFTKIKSIITLFTMTNPEKLYDCEAFTRDQREGIALYLSYQLLRTKEAREIIKQTLEQYTTAAAKVGLKGQISDDFFDKHKLELVDKNQLKLLHAWILTDTDYKIEISKILLDKIWSIGVNNTNVPLCVSDNPLVIASCFGDFGIDSYSVELMFPITPKLLLIMSDSQYYTHKVKQLNKFIPLSIHDVQHHNSLQAKQSFRYVFSNVNDFSVADKISKEDFEIINSVRERIITNLIKL